MPSIKCELKSCAFRGKRGACTRRKPITLMLTENRNNELYCSGWMTPETKLYTQILRGSPDEPDQEMHRG